MEHVLLKATTVAADLGEFEAVISTASIDREKDVVEPQAMVNAMAKWVAVGKLMPLAYSHRDPATGHVEVVGHINPASARIENDEVIAKGFVDQSTPRGQETWRLVKSGTLSFSFGYLIPDGGATKLKGGRLRIHEIDLYEISAVPVAPANNDTRVLAYKAEVRDLEKELQEARAELAEAREQLENMQQKTADATDKEPQRARSVDPLRSKADATALDVMSGGESLRKPPRHKPKQQATPRLSVAELRAQTHQVTLDVLTGGKP